MQDLDLCRVGKFQLKSTKGKPELMNQQSSVFILYKHDVSYCMSVRTELFLHTFKFLSSQFWEMKPKDQF